MPSPLNSTRSPSSTYSLHQVLSLPLIPILILLISSLFLSLPIALNSSEEEGGAGAVQMDPGLVFLWSCFLLWEALGGTNGGQHAELSSDELAAMAKLLQMKTVEHKIYISAGMSAFLYLYTESQHPVLYDSSSLHKLNN
jgi:hypothetical protein